MDNGDWRPLRLKITKSSSHVCNLQVHPAPRCLPEISRQTISPVTCSARVNKGARHTAPFGAIETLTFQQRYPPFQQSAALGRIMLDHASSAVKTSVRNAFGRTKSFLPQSSFQQTFMVNSSKPGQSQSHQNYFSVKPWAWFHADAPALRFIAHLFFPIRENSCNWCLSPFPWCLSNSQLASLLSLRLTFPV